MSSKRQQQQQKMILALIGVVVVVVGVLLVACSCTVRCAVAVAGVVEELCYVLSISFLFNQQVWRVYLRAARAVLLSLYLARSVFVCL
jgi:uncharacterized membrane protein YkgB